MILSALLYSIEKVSFVSRHIGSVGINDISFSVHNKHMRHKRYIHSPHKILILIKKKDEFLTPAMAFCK